MNNLFWNKHLMKNITSYSIFLGLPAFSFILLFILGCDREISTTPPEMEISNKKLFVISNPAGYDIYLNGRISGLKTPDSLSFLEFDEFQVGLIHPTYLDTTVNVSFGIEENKSISIDFTSQASFYSKIICTSTPTNAEIVLDDSATGTYTPGELHNIFPGNHSLRLRKEGYRSSKINLSLTSNSRSELHLNLEDTTEWLVYNTSNSLLPSNSITSIAIDKLDFSNPWIGTDDMGIVDLSSSTWENYSRNNSILPSNRIISMGYVQGGKIIIGLYDGLVTKQNNSWNSFTAGMLGVPSLSVSNIYVQDSEVYYGTVTNPGRVFIATDSGVLVSEGIRFVPDEFINSLLPSQTVTAITAYERNNKRLFIVGTLDDGIHIYNNLDINPRNQTYNMLNAGFISNRITAVAYTPGVYNSYVGVKISASMGDPIGMLYFLDETSNWHEINLDYAVINKILVNFDEIWLSTNNGIYKIEQRTRVTEHYTMENSPLTSNNVYDVGIDIAGNLWLATSRGVVRFKPE